MCSRRLTKRWKLPTQSPPSSLRRETGFWSSASLRGKSKPQIGRSRTTGFSTLPFEMANWTNVREYIDTQALARASEMDASPSPDPSTPKPHEPIRKIYDGGSIIMTGAVASVKGLPGFGVYAASNATLCPTQEFLRDALELRS